MILFDYISEMKKMKKRTIYFDYLNVLSCIAVVFIHCNGIFHSFSDSAPWKSALLIQVIFFFAVPVFVMLSGATLLDYKKKYNTKTFIKKRIKKIILPYVFWSYVYFVLHDKTFDIILFITKFIDCDIEPIFWFFPMIILMYLLIPIITNLTEEKNYKKLKYILILLMFSSLLKSLCAIFPIEYPNLFIDVNYRFWFIAYIILGFLLSKIDIDKKKRIIIYFFAIISLCINYIYTYKYSIMTLKTNYNLMNYVSITNLIPACAVFLIFKNLNFNSLDFNKLISKLSNYSYGVYLIHYIFIRLSWNSYINIQAFSYRVFFPLILYFACIFIIAIIKKIPLINRIIT